MMKFVSPCFFCALSVSQSLCFLSCITLIHQKTLIWSFVLIMSVSHSSPRCQADPNPLLGSIWSICSYDFCDAHIQMDLRCYKSTELRHLREIRETKVQKEVPGFKQWIFLLYRRSKYFWLFSPAKILWVPAVSHWCYTHLNRSRDNQTQNAVRTKNTISTRDSNMNQTQSPNTTSNILLSLSSASSLNMVPV